MNIITGKERFMGAMAYFSWLFLLIALIVSREDRTEFVRHHINQAFMLQIIASATILLSKVKALGLIASILSFAVTVFLIWGIISAASASDKDIPVLSAVEFIK